MCCYLLGIWVVKRDCQMCWHGGMLLHLNEGKTYRCSLGKEEPPPATKEESESGSCCWVRNAMGYSSQDLKIVGRMHPAQPSLPMADYGFAGRDLLLPCAPLQTPDEDLGTTTPAVY